MTVEIMVKNCGSRGAKPRPRACKGNEAPAEQALRSAAARAVAKGQKGVRLSPATEFRPGQSGNPEGRPAAGASVKDWWNILMGGSSKADLERIIADDLETDQAKKAAAAAILVMTGVRTDLDNQRLYLKMLLDYTDGRPIETRDLRISGGLTLASGRLTLEALQALDEDEEDA